MASWALAAEDNCLRVHRSDSAAALASSTSTRRRRLQQDGGVGRRHADKAVDELFEGRVRHYSNTLIKREDEPPFEANPQTHKRRLLQTRKRTRRGGMKRTRRHLHHRHHHHRRPPVEVYSEDGWMYLGPTTFGIGVSGPQQPELGPFSTDEILRLYCEGALKSGLKMRFVQSGQKKSRLGAYAVLEELVAEGGALYRALQEAGDNGIQAFDDDDVAGGREGRGSGGGS